MLTARSITRGFAVLGLGLFTLLLTSCAARHPAPPTPHVVKPAGVDVESVVRALDAERMVGHIHRLAGQIGVRRSGTPGEAAAVAYIANELKRDGYTVHTRVVPLPNGLNSANVYAELPGQSSQAVLISGHIDSKAPAPGANDDASGVAVMLELARVLKGTHPPYRCIFVGFGAEELIDRKHQGHHHYGSRAMAQDTALLQRLYSMTSLDMVGVGTTLHIDTQGKASDRWRDYLAAVAHAHGLAALAGHSKPLSDHEAFENRGVPVAYLHWEKDSTYHTRADRPEHIQRQRLLQTAQLMVHALLHTPTGHQIIKLPVKNHSGRRK